MGYFEDLNDLWKVVDLAYGVGHFHCGFGVTSSVSDSSNCLVGSIGCQYTKNHGFAGVFTRTGDTLGGGSRNEFVVIGITFDDNAKTDHGVDIAPISQSPSGQR